MAKLEQLKTTHDVLNQAVADLYTARIVFHQVHWYMRGRGFLAWHPKMDKYMDALDEYMDEISERLITLNGSPYSTLAEFSEQTQIEERKGDFSQSVEDQLNRVLSVYRYLAKLFQKGLDITDEAGDSVTNDIFNVAKADAEKTIWMLSAELGQSPNL